MTTPPTAEAYFTRRATILTPDTSGIVTDTSAIRAAATAHRVEQARMVAAVRGAEDESLSRLTRRACRATIDEVESTRAAAEADVIRAIQAANPGAEYAAVMAAARALSSRRQAAEQAAAASDLAHPLCREPLTTGLCDLPADHALRAHRSDRSAL